MSIIAVTVQKKKKEKEKQFRANVQYTVGIMGE